MQLKYSYRSRRHEGGYVLLAILFALTLLIIGLAAAAPRAATAAQRTKEDELIRRGQQYGLAVRRFYKKFGRYPSNMDQLENTNNIRFLRRKYLDPLTGKDDWAPIQFGQARPALGFFGQKVINTGGLSPSGPGLGPSTLGSGLGGSSAGSTNPDSTGSSSSSASSNGPGAAKSGTGSNPNSPSGPSGTAGNPLSGDQLSGKTFGGGAIVGFSVPSKKESLKEFQQKKHYNEWQFVYDPTMDPTLRGAGGAGAPGTASTQGLTPNQGIGGLNPASPGTTGPSTTGLGGTSTTPQNPR